MLPDETSVCASPESTNAFCGEDILGRTDNAPCIPMRKISPIRDLEKDYVTSL